MRGVRTRIYACRPLSAVFSIAFTQELPRRCPFLKQLNLTGCEGIDDKGAWLLLRGLLLSLRHAD